jgi:hypothetical protein
MSVISIATTGIKEIFAHPFYSEGALEILHDTHYGIVTYNLSTGAVVKISGAATVTHTKGTATSINIYKENGKFYVQNTTAGTVNLYFSVYPLLSTSYIK